MESLAFLCVSGRLRAGCGGLGRLSPKHTEEVQKFGWRGRWRQMRTLEYYLQEVAAQSLLPSLPPEVRERIQHFASAAPFVVEAYVHMGGLRPWLSAVASGIPKLPRTPLLSSDHRRQFARRPTAKGC